MQHCCCYSKKQQMTVEFKFTGFSLLQIEIATAQFTGLSRTEILFQMRCLKGERNEHRESEQ